MSSELMMVIGLLLQTYSIINICELWFLTGIYYYLRIGGHIKYGFEIEPSSFKFVFIVWFGVFMCCLFLFSV